MIRTILSNALRLAADALDTHPAPWEAERDSLLGEISNLKLDLDAAVADSGEAREDFIQDAQRALGAHFSPFAGTIKSIADLVAEYERLRATNATLRKDLCEHMAKAYRPCYADRDKMRHALFIAGVHGGPGAWRWHSDPLGTTHGDVGAFCRLMLERLDARAPEATDSADLATRLDAARDGLRTAQSCLDRLGEVRVVDALLAVERGLARSAPSLSDITTPKSAADVVREAVAEQAHAAVAALVAGVATPDPTAEQIEAYLRGSADWHLRASFDKRPKYYWRNGTMGVWLGGNDLAAIAEAEGVTPAEMRARILATSAPAEPTDEDLGRIARAQANSLGYDAAGRALYNLGREHGGRAASAIATESIAMATKWRMAEAENAALLARAEKAELRLSSQTAELLMLRGIDDRMMSMGRSYDWLREHVREIGEAIKVCGTLAGPSLADQIRDLVAKWQRQGEELEAVRKELCATRSSLAHALDCVSEAKMQLDRDEVSKALDALDAVENGLAKATPDLAAAPEPLDKSAALREAGWSYKPHLGWTLGVYGLGYLDTDDAYRAMVEDREREKVRAATPRDTMTHPEPEGAAGSVENPSAKVLHVIGILVRANVKHSVITVSPTYREVHFRVPNDVESMKRYETIDATEETASKIAEWMMGGE